MGGGVAAHTAQGRFNGLKYTLLKLGLSCHPTRAEPDLPHSIVMLLDVHSIHATSLKSI